MLNIQTGELMHYTSAENLATVIFTRLDLSETAQLTGGGKKRGNSLTCKRGQRRTTREEKKSSAEAASPGVRSVHKKLECVG